MSPLALAILEFTQDADERGVTMGEVVDALEDRGFVVEQIEQEFWSLLGQRRLTPGGYVGRRVRRKSAKGNIEQVRCYELLFVPWSADLDQQLDLELVEDEP
ncbi:MAG: hypothetical protein AAF799_39815 [Myxococcota bacterium]